MKAHLAELYTHLPPKVQQDAHKILDSYYLLPEIKCKILSEVCSFYQKIRHLGYKHNKYVIRKHKLNPTNDDFLGSLDSLNSKVEVAIDQSAESFVNDKTKSLIFQYKDSGSYEERQSEFVQYLYPESQLDDKFTKCDVNVIDKDVPLFWLQRILNVAIQKQVIHNINGALNELVHNPSDHYIAFESYDLIDNAPITRHGDLLVGFYSRIDNLKVAKVEFESGGTDRFSHQIKIYECKKHSTKDKHCYIFEEAIPCVAFAYALVYLHAGLHAENIVNAFVGNIERRRLLQRQGCNSKRLKYADGLVRVIKQ